MSGHEKTPFHGERLPGGWGGGVLHQIFGTWVQHAKKTWTQSEIRFCENEGSTKNFINEKGGQLDRKLREDFTKCLKSVKKKHFGEKLDQL